jgi:hypothetical protein
MAMKVRSEELKWLSEQRRQLSWGNNIPGVRSYNLKMAAPSVTVPCKMLVMY